MHDVDVYIANITGLFFAYKKGKSSCLVLIVFDKITPACGFHHFYQLISISEIFQKYGGFPEFYFPH